jgi:putative methyltransferase (TIGR04325 family)
MNACDRRGRPSRRFMNAASRREPPPVSWRQWLPKPLRIWWRRHFRRRVFHGDYPDWAAACAVAQGYDDPGASARVVAAAHAVRAGQAVWDRDGVLFHEPRAHEPLVAALRRAAVAAGGGLDVVDFGGGMGSTWWQHREALREFRVSWRVVERAMFVETGQREFSDAALSFHPTLAAAQAAGPVQVILLSSVLPYVADPHALLREVAAWRAPHVIVDRTPFIAGGRDRVVVQSAPRELGGGSYPCWLFDRAGVAAAFHTDYALVGEWPVPFDQADEAVIYQGLHFQRRPSVPAAPISAAK